MIVRLEDCERSWIVPRMAELEHELFGRGAWSQAAIEQELAAPARMYLFDITNGVGSTPGELRGYAGFWYDGDDAELMTVGVSTRFQRQGIAAQLLARLIAMAKEQGARRMILEVRVDNEPALALYRRFGFSRLGLRRRYYQPGNIDAYTMGLDLQPRIVGFAAAADADIDSGAPSQDAEKNLRTGVEQ